jgi:hypothetical protein
MSHLAFPRNLVVLTADKNAQFAIRGILSRNRSLGFRLLPQSSIEYVTHPEKDPGVLRTAKLLLSPFLRTHPHALAIMDREGSGCGTSTAEQMEQQIEADLLAAGWADRAAALVINPELDIWVWADSPHVEAEIGWADQSTNVRAWLVQKGFLFSAEGKPLRPKEALEAALRHVHMPRSSALYKSLAEKVSLVRCIDRAFLKLKTTLQSWFPET